MSTHKRHLAGLTRCILGLGVLLTASAATAQPCCECRCPRNEEPACSEDFGLDEGGYLASVCQPLGCSIAVCTDKACAQANRCPRSEEGRCADGFDNDADSLVDCDDPDCDGTDDCNGEPGGDDCCASQDVAGCNIASCESCVCGSDAFCCEEVWDFNCGALAGAQCADVCGCGTPATPEPTSDTTPTGVTPTPEPTSDATQTPGEGPDCCVGREVSGCEITSCESCVCGLDSFCCDETWDTNCALIANSDCPGACECGGATTPTPTDTPGPASNCCAGRPEEDGPGCSLGVCETCVCNVDTFCCTEFWDQTCADIAGAACLADCACDTAPPLPTATPTRFQPSRAPTTPPPVPTTPVAPCTSSADCAAGLVCNAAGQCVAPSPTTGGSSGNGGGGCSIQSPVERRSDFAWLVLPLLFPLIMAFRRSASSHSNSPRERHPTRPTR